MLLISGNTYSKRWVDSRHTYNFSYLYAFIFILILYSHYSYSKFEVLIPLILNNTHDVDFQSSWIDIYMKHKINMILIRTLQYSVEGCVFALLAVFVINFLPFFVNATTTKTVNFDEWFESLASYRSICLNLWIGMSRPMNQIYFECYEFDVNIVIILIATCTYKSMLNWVRMNQSRLTHTQNFMSTYEYSFMDSLLISQMYICNWLLQSFSMNYDLVSYTTYFVSVNFYAWVAELTV